VVAKFNANVSNLLWCGYLGGDGADAGYSLKLGNSGDLFVTGGTEGQNFPTTPNALTTAYQGGSADGFIARISNDGSTLERATYIGTSAYDQTFFVEVDGNENVYVYGQSLGTLTLTPNVYFNTNGRQFIQRLDSDLSTLQLSTRFGSGGTAVNISPTAFLVDICDRIYVSGWGGGTNNFWNNATGNTNNMPLTTDAFQNTTNGSDFYFMVMDAEATGLLYATYFGGSGNVQEHVDGGTSRFDPSGVIYQAVCAGCGGSSAFPTTPGAWSNTNNAPGGCNVGVIKLDMEITGVNVEITAGDNAQGCAPLQVQFTSQLVNASDITWDFGDGNFSDQPNPTHTFTSPGTYIIALMGMDTVLCTGGQFADTAYATITVFDIDNPADAGPDQVACGQGSVQVGSPAIAGYTYAWSPAVGLSNPNVAQPTASSSGQQTYTLTVTDQNGCQSTDQVLVDVFDAQATGDTTVCDGGATVQLGASQAATWTWTPAAPLNDPAAQFPLATVTETTQFSVEIDNGAGCVITREVTVQVSPSIVVSAGADQAACTGGSVTLSGSGGVQFEWSPATYLNNPSIANPVSTPEQNITYTLTATDQNGCTGTDQVTVSVNQLPTVTAAPATEVCAGDVVQLQSSGALTYAWSPAAGLNNPNSVSPQATMTETTTFTVTGTDANGCVNTAEVTVGVFNANATGQSGVCPGFTAQLGVDNGVAWNWSPANLLNDPTAQNPIATVNTPTTFNVAVSNGQGCVVVLDIPVDVFPPAAANAGPDRVACDGQPVTLSGSGGVQYQWSPATFLNDPAVQSPVSTPEQDITYTLTVTDANGCVGTDQVNVAVLPSPIATTSPDVEICIGQSTALTAEGGVSYAWTPLVGINNPNSANPTVAPAQTTTYVVTVTDANGCTANGSVTVNVFNVTASAIPGNSLCIGDSVQIVASGGTAFSWEPSDGLSSPNAQSTFASPIDNTTYTVTATAAAGCEVSADVTLTVLPAPAAAFEGEFIPTCDGVRATFINSTLDADSYAWDFSVAPFSSDMLNPIIYFPNGQGPTVTLTASLSSTGCDNSLTIDYSGQTFTNDSVEIVWSNVITPNGDGLNDCFKPGFIGEFSDCYELKVYNRWGALLFESIGTGNCWDGRTKAGNLVPEGTYYYIAKVLEEERAGWMQVVLD
jgi:gliding motility-associated-like protein